MVNKLEIADYLKVMLDTSCYSKDLFFLCHNLNLLSETNLMYLQDILSKSNNKTKTLETLCKLVSVESLLGFKFDEVKIVDSYEDSITLYIGDYTVILFDKVSNKVCCSRYTYGYGNGIITESFTELKKSNSDNISNINCMSVIYDLLFSVGYDFNINPYKSMVKSGVHDELVHSLCNSIVFPKVIPCDECRGKQIYRYYSDKSKEHTFYLEESADSLKLYLKCKNSYLVEVDNLSKDDILSIVKMFAFIDCCTIIEEIR